MCALCLALGRPALDGSCRLFIRFSGVKTAVMQKSPDASGAMATAMGPGAAATPTGRMLVGDAVPRDTWPGAARQFQGA